MSLLRADSITRPQCERNRARTDERRVFPLLSLPDLVLRQMVLYLDNRTLKHVRRTCATLSYYATRPLFSSITLTPHALHFDHLFENLLKHESLLNERLARYVRTLNFETRYPSPNPSSKQCFWYKSHMHAFAYEAQVTSKNIRAAKGQPHFYWMVTKLHALLQQLPNLQHIVIDDSKRIGTEMTPSDLEDVPIFHRQNLQTIAKQDLVVGEDIVLGREPEDLSMYIDGVCIAVWAVLNGMDLGAVERPSHNARSTTSRRVLDVRLKKRQRVERKPPSLDAYASTEYLYALPSLGISRTDGAKKEEKEDHGLIEAADKLGKIVSEILSP